MSAEQELLDACSEWRRLAITEGESISSRNWSLVAACQSALAHLQPRLTRLIQQARADWLHTDDRSTVSEKEKMLRDLMADLVSQEQTNANLLTGIRAAAKEKMRQLDLARNNLKGIQRSYASPTPAAWSSIS